MATATSRRASSAPKSALAAGAVALVLALSAVDGAAHPLHEPPGEEAARAEACAHDEERADAFDAVRLGTPEAELRARFGDALGARAMRPHRPPRPPSSGVQAGSPTATSTRYPGQQRLRRTLTGGDIAVVEYDLSNGVVYRIRWRLADRFSVPIMADLVAQATACYGEPHYDQEPDWKLSEAKASLRRSGWEHGDRLLEVRQLHPLNGGPVYVTTTDLAAVRRIVAAGGAASPDPVSSPPWWTRASRAAAPLSDNERRQLTRDFARLLAITDFRAGPWPEEAREAD